MGFNSGFKVLMAADRHGAYPQFIGRMLIGRILATTNQVWAL